MDMIEMSADFRKSVKVRAHEVQKERGIPLTMIANKIHISATTLSKIIRGNQKEVSVEVYKKLDDWLSRW